MSACLEIEWKPKTLSKDSESKDLKSAVKKMAEGLPKDKPVLFFFGSSKTLPVKSGSKKEPKLSKQAKKTQDLADCFNDKSFKVQVALKFFYCYDIDVTDISEAESPFICHENAPMLVIYYNGEILNSLTSCSSGRLYGVLATALKNNDYNISNVNRQVNKPLRAFYDIERKLYYKEKEYDRVKASSKSKTRVDKVNKEYSETTEKRDELKSAFLKILNDSMKENL